MQVKIFLMNARLNAIINFVRQGNRVADIGTDHAYLPIQLVRSGKSFFVVATDKNSGPIQAAKKNISAAGLEKNIEVRQGDGLKILKSGEVETICISGMGGTLIAEILSASPEIFQSASQLILQPMNAVDELKKFLRKNNWFIIDEDLAEDGGIIYEIICAEKNFSEIRKPTKKESSALLKKYYAQKAEKIQRVLDEMKKSPAAVQTEKFAQLQAEMNFFQTKQNF